MSLSSLSNFTVLIKKMARKSTLGRKITTKKQRSRTRRYTTTAAQDQDLASVSTCSSNEEEKLPVNVPVTATKLNNNSKIDHLVTTTIVPPQIVEDESNKSTTITATSDSNLKLSSSIYHPGDSEQQQEDDVISSDSSSSCSGQGNVIIRDFAYPDSSPLHHGQLNKKSLSNHNESNISLSSSRFNGCQAKALYDFTPETDYEIAMKSGQTIWIQYRQCAGWLIADVDDETGLVPESYIELI
ncbi:hypothetical protein BCR42DRAFT_421565 [Absidia repens]|uniref:SH3 domain-containing protein n=1 Tax=Absidia repens TaxID=90262 RepID=A0A1X2I7K4_9FUNG|nr:hypothetical protein BCR42DRAFT_421565 [Absidia repens]